MGLRTRVGRAARVWLACLAMQCAAVPVAEAAARPGVAVCVVAGEAPSRKVARDEVRAPALLARELRRGGAPPVAVRAQQPAATQVPRVLVPRLYLRLRSIRR